MSFALKRTVFLIIEIAAIAASFFAVYEIAFSRRYVETLNASLNFCDTSDAETAKNTNYFKALNKSLGRFVYLDLRVSGVDSVCPPDNKSSPATVTKEPDGSWDLLLPGRETIYTTPGLNGSYSILNTRQISENIFIDYVFDVSEAGYVSATGIFYVKSTDGEGDRYYYLIPAPYSVETQRLQRCTAALRDKHGIDWLTAYVTGCLFVG